MNLTTKHRGPDASSFWCGHGVSLGHNRLSIIDLSEEANQPMWDNEKKIVITYNGEIYNFPELREQLSLEYSFSTKSDTEVILAAYKKWGIECVNYLKGMFAFAIFDTRSQDLWLVRDPMGIKPLYYFNDGEKTIFSSEIKGILEHPIKRSVDTDALNMYLSLYYIPSPLTMFEDIKKLPAGHLMRVGKNGDTEIKKYWKEPSLIDTKLSYNDTKEKLRNIFDKSVSRQLVSDRPVGVFLSGGMDSTAVLGATSKLHNKPSKTYSIKFDVNKEHNEKFNTDAVLAKKTAEYYGTEHNEVTMSPESALEALPSVIRHLGEPNFNPTAIAQHLLSKEAKRSVAVVLGGDGGDELFGGYPRYYYSFLLSKYKKIPGLIRKTFEYALNKTGNEQLVNKISIDNDLDRVLALLSQSQEKVSALLNKDIVKKGLLRGHFKEEYFANVKSTQDDDFVKKFMQVDRQSWLIDESLFRTDAMTMSFGLEQRVPILDEDLVNFSAQIPTKWMMHLSFNKPSSFQGKDIWGNAIKDYLPKHMRYQPKRGWFSPMAKWMRDDFKQPVEEILLSDSPAMKYLDQENIIKLWEEHKSGKGYHLNTVWAVVTFVLWYNSFDIS